MPLCTFSLLLRMSGPDEITGEPVEKGYGYFNLYKMAKLHKKDCAIDVCFEGVYFRRSLIVLARGGKEEYHYHQHENLGWYLSQLDLLKDVKSLMAGGWEVIYVGGEMLAGK